MKLKPNKIRYGQDFSQHIGVPSGVDFKVASLGDGRFKLVGDGYGELDRPDQYGNGALYVWGLSPKQRKRFESAIKMPRKYRVTRRLVEVATVIVEAMSRQEAIDSVEAEGLSGADNVSCTFKAKLDKEG